MASTAQLSRIGAGEQQWISLEGAIPGTESNISRPFDLDRATVKWAETLRNSSEAHFRSGGKRVCVPFSAGNRWLGCAILN